MDYFKKLGDYREYLQANPFHLNLGINLDDYENLDSKIVKETYFSVDPKNKIPFPEEMDDLIRLHYLIT